MSKWGKELMGAMGAELDLAESPDDSEYLRYRSLSGMAVVSLLAGLLSLTTFLHPAMAVLSLAGGILGLCAARRIRHRTEEFTGSRVAWAAVLLNASSLFGGVGYHAYRYTYEVPEGYMRVSFNDLQPDPETPQLPVPPSALELNGQRIFVKGFVYPDGQKAGIKQFILVPDMGTCCFGGQPKLTDMIEVTLRDPLRIKYSYQRRGLAGVLHVSARKKPVTGLDGVYYQLDASVVR